MLTRSFIFVALLSIAVCALTRAQIQPEKRSLSVNGYTGEVTIGQMNGQACVDIEDLVRVANGSLGFLGDQIKLTLPAASSSTSKTDSEAGVHPGLSREFVKAGIETIAEMREWASALGQLIKNGYGVTDSLVVDQREQASRALKLAGATVSTPADKDALQLLSNEFNAVSEWSEELLKAKKSMDTAKYTISPEALRNEPLSQKIITCGRFLDRMLVGGAYQDDASCH